MIRNARFALKKEVLAAGAVAAAMALAFAPLALAQTRAGTREQDLAALAAIPRVEKLMVPRESKIGADRYKLTGAAADAFERFIMRAKDSPEGVDSRSVLAKHGHVAPASPKTFPLPPTSPPVSAFSREPVDSLSIALAPEKPVRIQAYVPLSPDEFRMLSGLLLYAKGESCAAAIGLFHRVSLAPGPQGQAQYYLAMCSKKLGLEGDFLERARRTVDSTSTAYAAKILKEVDVELPDDFVVPFGEALFKHLGAAGNLKLPTSDPVAVGNARYWLAAYGARVGKFKTVKANASQVPEDHPKRFQAELLLAVAEQQLGNLSGAIAIQEKAVARAEATSAERELTATAALNLARMQFQAERFKEASQTFVKVYKDHPLWLQSLTELGWAQLRSNDHEGAIGNMYSVQSPYFRAIYKPESYVIRTIGYLNICQYGDAYRTLSKLERQYRPWLQKMDAYSERAPMTRLEAVRQFVSTNAKAEQDVGGLPVPVLREMARHKDYLNGQKTLNARIDERAAYGRVDASIEIGMADARAAVTASRNRLAELRARLAAIGRDRGRESERLPAKAELDRELDVLNMRFFDVDVMAEAKAAAPAFAGEAASRAEARVAGLKATLDGLLGARLERMRGDLRRMLDNNEILRYETFAGAGENIRFQIAGGEASNRVPASAIPKSKSLRWDFDGEYWEDEVGHYRSSLTNNCPESAPAINQAGVKLEEGGDAE